MQLTRSIKNIEASFDKIWPVKQKLTQMNEEICGVLSKNINFHINDTGSIWKEEASVKYLSEETKVLAQILNESGVVKDILEDISLRSESLYKAECANNFLANSRSF